MNRQTVLPLAIAALAACSDAAGPNGQPLTMSFASNPRSTAAAASVTGLHADLTVGDGTNTLVLTRVQLALGEIELEPPGIDDCDNSGPGSSDCPEIRLAPALVDLPLTGGITTAFSTAIPAGSYHEVELKVDAVESDDFGAAAFFASNPNFPRGKSVRVEGTFNGQPFVFTSSVEAEVELEFEPPLTVDQSGMNVTINVDVSSWFRSNGTLIDPLGVDAQSRISSNISASFEAYHDDDRDGRRDD
jgi:hypothetical protein